MSNITPYNFDGANIRVLEIGGEPWFAGKDVAEALGYSNASDAISTHCKGVAKRYPLQTSGGMQEVRVINEPDMLRLIVNSTLPAAERFERWVFEDVLPQIRKTGSYGAKTDPMVVLSDPAAMRTLLLGYSEKVLALEDRVNELAPKADALDRIATFSEGSYCMRDAAKVQQVPERKFIQYLDSHQWIYQQAPGQWRVYAEARKDGLMEQKTTTGQKPDGTEWQSVQVRVTAKGMAKLARVFESEGAPA